MDYEEHQKQRDLLRTYQNHLRVLEIQGAQFGINVPPYIVTEIERVRAEISHTRSELEVNTPVSTRASLRQIRQQARKAYYAKQWQIAEDLLIQVLAVAPESDDLRRMLGEAQQQIDLEAFYQTICELRDENKAEAVLNAFNDLDQRCPGYPDNRGLRQWAQNHHNENHVEAFGEAQTSASDPTSQSGLTPYIPSNTDAAIKALIVEDSAPYQITIRSVLEELGCLCKVSCNLDEALTLIRSSTFDVITVDMQLDKDDVSGQLGFLVLDQILLHQKTPAVFVVSGLAWEASDVRNFFVEYKSFDFFSKPFNPVVFKRRISQVLDTRRNT